MSTDTSDTANTVPPSADKADTSAHSTTATTRRRGSGRPFTAGHDPRRNTAGRPPKGETFAEKYRRATERDADEMIEAHVKRSKTMTAVGARDFELAAAYHMGRPVQKYVFKGGESPADALDARLAQLLGQTVDGEARLLDDNAESLS